MHLAGVTHTRRASDYDAVNDSRHAQNLVDAAARRDVERFVHVSTRAIDEHGGAYSRSKARAEAHVRDAPFHWVVLRIAEVYEMDSREGVDALIASARAGRPLFLVGRGDQEVCPVHGQDAAAAVAAALDSAAAVGRVYTVGGECVTVAAFAAACVEASGSRSRVVRVPEPVVALLSRLSAVVPLPLVPDQLARLRAPKGRPSPERAEDLGLRLRTLEEGLRVAAASQQASPVSSRRLDVVALVALVVAFSYLVALAPGGDNQKAHYVFVAALADGKPYVDDFVRDPDVRTIDVTEVDGRLYSTKAPGLAMVSLPAYLVLDAVGVVDDASPVTTVWALHLWSVVLPAIVLVLLVRRVAERLEPGTGLLARTGSGRRDARAPVRDGVLLAHPRGDARVCGFRPALFRGARSGATLGRRTGRLARRPRDNRGVSAWARCHRGRGLRGP